MRAKRMGELIKTDTQQCQAMHLDNEPFHENAGWSKPKSNCSMQDIPMHIYSSNTTCVTTTTTYACLLLRHSYACLLRRVQLGLFPGKYA